MLDFKESLEHGQEDDVQQPDELGDELKKMAEEIEEKPKSMQDAQSVNELCEILGQGKDRKEGAALWSSEALVKAVKNYEKSFVKNYQRWGGDMRDAFRVTNADEVKNIKTLIEAKGVYEKLSDLLKKEVLEK